MERFRFEPVSAFWIAGHESSSQWIVVSGAEVIEAEVRVVLLAAVETVVRRRTADREFIAKCVVFVGVCYIARAVGKVF